MPNTYALSSRAKKRSVSDSFSRADKVEYRGQLFAFGQQNENEE
jgi:hypothetical protein